MGLAAGGALAGGAGSCVGMDDVEVDDVDVDGVEVAETGVGVAGSAVGSGDPVSPGAEDVEVSELQAKSVAPITVSMATENKMNRAIVKKSLRHTEFMPIKKPCPRTRQSEKCVTFPRRPKHRWEPWTGLAPVK